jgi:hypothetical protein
VMEEETTLAAPSVDSEVSGSLGLGQTCSSTGTETTLPPNTARRPRWLTQTLQEAKEQVGAPKNSFWVSHPSNKLLH